MYYSLGGACSIQGGWGCTTSFADRLPWLPKTLHAEQQSWMCEFVRVCVCAHARNERVHEATLSSFIGLWNFPGQINSLGRKTEKGSIPRIAIVSSDANKSGRRTGRRGEMWQKKGGGAVPVTVLPSSTCMQFPPAFLKLIVKENHRLFCRRHCFPVHMPRDCEEHMVWRLQEQKACMKATRPFILKVMFGLRCSLLTEKICCCCVAKIK